MSRQYFSGNATNAQAIGTNFHTVATAAGWSLEHADAVAIGGGDAANPAWDGTVSAAGDSYGKVIYKMPEPTQAEQDAGITTQWLVQVELVAAGGTTPTGVIPKIATGKSHTNGVLDDAGTAVTLANSNNADSMATADFHINADTHRLALVVGGNYGYAIAVERQRTLGGVTRDPVAIAGVGDFYTWVGMPSGKYGGAIVRDAAFEEYGEAKWCGIGEFGSNNLSKASSLAANGNQSGLPVGPLLNSGGIAGMLESFVLMPEGDTAAGATQNIRYGEHVYAYKALSAADAAFCPSLGTFCIAGAAQVS